MKKLIFLFMAFISLNVMAQEEEEPVYVMVSKMASFPGGQEKMMEFIQNNKQMAAAAAKEAGVSGRVFVNFIVEKDGSLTNIKIMRGLGKSCDEEVIKLIQSMPKWEPGQNSGKVVRTSFTLPINF